LVVNDDSLDILSDSCVAPSHFSRDHLVLNPPLPAGPLFSEPFPPYDGFPEIWSGCPDDLVRFFAGDLDPAAEAEAPLWGLPSDIGSNRPETSENPSSNFLGGMEGCLETYNFPKIGSSTTALTWPTDRTQPQFGSSSPKSSITLDSHPLNASKYAESSTPSSSEIKNPRKPQTRHSCRWQQCQETFDDTPQLKRHLQIHTSFGSKCQWNNCPRNLGSRSLLNKHLDTHIKPHQCLRCQHRTATKRDLSRHIKSHTNLIGNAVYFCPSASCSYRKGGSKSPFGRLDNAKRHISRKHTDSTEEPVSGIYER